MASGSKVGNAYITVTPKLADGFDSKLKEKGTPTGKDYGSRFSGAAQQAMSVGVVAIGNILANAIQSAAQNVGQLFADTINYYAEYEQLSGGVEKIFDEANIDQILKDANAAYKDLNMSANEYLAAINKTGATFAQTMGDQKGYDTARKGLLAIADYASGTGRSVDELTEKFSMITRSTSSYQSIADQFSGILPATSKDFLEQAQAAGFLSDSYTSLTEVPVAEYQEALTLMLEKGVAEMGLAGNTAMESAETISGSLAMLKSSWANLLTELGKDNADLSARIDEFVESAMAVFDNVGPRLVKIVGSILEAVPMIIDKAAPYVEQLAAEIGSFIEDHQDEIRAAGEVMFDGLTQAISFMLEAAIQALGAVLGEMIKHIPEYHAAMFEATVELMLALVEGIVEGIEPAMNALEDWVNQAFRTVGDFFTSVGDLVSGALDGIVTSVQGALDNASSFVQSVFTGIQSFVGSIMGAIQGVISGAVSAIQGIFNGLQSVVGVVTGIFNSVKEAITNPIKTAKQIISDAINTIKNIINGAHLELPHFKLPHFVIDGGELPWGIGGQGRAPTIDVQWYAKGGIVDGATLIGAGEAGPEMILPASGGLMDDFSEAVAAKVDTEAVVDEIRRFRREIGPIIADYAPHMTQREFNRAARTAVAYG